MAHTAIPRIVVCGAVDDGKSTVMGRLLAETGSIPLDELERVTDSAGNLDYSRLTDGLESEREQGITIDVAYRYLGLPDGQRALLADSPGHEQYTRNMAVAAAEADVAILVVDSVRGIRPQTLRHAAVCHLMGVDSYIVLLNKMDALGGDVQQHITQLTADITDAINGLDHAGSLPSSRNRSLTVIPVSGLTGANIAESSSGSETLIATISAAVAQGTRRESADDDPLRIPVQAVLRSGEQRWYAGTIAVGSVKLGDAVSLWPSGHSARVTEVLVAGTSVAGAQSGDSVALQLDHEVDLNRGDIIVAQRDAERLPSSKAHLADLVWLDTEVLNTSSSYLLRVGPHSVPVKCELVRYRLDLDSMAQTPASSLSMNDIGRVEVTADRPFLLDPYQLSRETGGFVLCDRMDGRTVAAGMAVHELQRVSEVSRHSFAIDRAQRETLNGVRAGVLWLTGLPGSGKSTIADAVEKLLFDRGIRSYVLDGDAVRQTLSGDLGFSAEDRAENVRRVAHVAQMMMDAGLVVIVSLVSPFAADRNAARELFADTDFAEVFVDTPLEICQQRDPKGLYARAAVDTSIPLSGVGQNYEAPLAPELHLDGSQSVELNAAQLMDWVIRRRV